MGAVTGVLAAVSEALARERVGSPSLDAVHEGLVAEAREDLRALGMEPEEVLRVRPDRSRCVMVCRHPRWGRCVYKSLSSQGPPGRRHAELENLRFLARHGDGLFPRIHHVEATFTVLEHIPGRNLRELSAEEWEDVDLEGFLARLRDLRAAPFRRTLPLRDSRRVIHRYVDKMLKCCRRIRPMPWPGLLWNRRRARRVDHLIELALDATERTRLPASLTHDDLYPDNVRVSSDGGGIFFIDEEKMQEGFVGFDCAWLLTQLTRIGNCPPERLRELYVHTCNDRFLGAEGAEVVVRAVMAFQLELLAAHLGPRRRGRRPRTLLATVRRDLAETHATAAPVEPVG